MELRHLRYFVAVAEALHFGRAARQLGIAQPPLSQQIQQLETELGVRLLERSPRKVTLTEAGRLFLAEAKATLDRAERARRIAQQARSGEAGTLTLGYINSAPMHDEFVAIARLFRERFPNVKLCLEPLTMGEQVGALLDERLDASLARAPIHEAGRSLATLPIIRESAVIVLPEDHKLARRARVPMAALADEPFVLFRRETAPGLFDEITRACQRAGFSPRVEQFADQVQTIAGLVAAGFGVTIMPASIARFRRQGVVYREVPGLTFEIVLAYRRDDVSPVLQSLLGVVRDVVAQRS